MLAHLVQHLLAAVAQRIEIHVSDVALSVAWSESASVEVRVDRLHLGDGKAASTAWTNVMVGCVVVAKHAKLAIIVCTCPTNYLYDDKGNGSVRW